VAKNFCSQRLVQAYVSVVFLCGVLKWVRKVSAHFFLVFLELVVVQQALHGIKKGTYCSPFVELVLPL
jgi:hypothetical protein